jgi:hypothetical protein
LSPKCIIIFSFIANVLLHQLCFIVSAVITYLITPCSHVATIMLPCCHLAALMPPPPPLYYCRYTAATTRLLPSPRCHVRPHVTTKLPPLPLPPCRHHHRHHCQHCQAATATTKLPPLPLSTLRDKFDNEKEFCNMTDIDFVRHS